MSTVRRRSCTSARRPGLPWLRGDASGNACGLLLTGITPVHTILSRIVISDYRWIMTWPRMPHTPRATSFQVSPALRHDVRNHLRNLIFDGTLQPGDRIVESRLARELGISQTPVREALRELEQMGLVVSYPNRGSSVRKDRSRRTPAKCTPCARTSKRWAVALAIERMTDADLDTLDGLIDGHDRCRRSERSRVADRARHQVPRVHPANAPGTACCCARGRVSAR